jgi:glycine betaine/proline transport system substrate-binding protein
MTGSAPISAGAEVYTNTRAGLVAECPNVGAFLNNLEFTLEMENEIMGAILDDGIAPEDGRTNMACGQS